MKKRLGVSPQTNAKYFAGLQWTLLFPHPGLERVGLNRWVGTSAQGYTLTQSAILSNNL